MWNTNVFAIIKTEEVPDLSLFSKSLGETVLTQHYSLSSEEHSSLSSNYEQDHLAKQGLGGMLRFLPPLSKPYHHFCKVGAMTCILQMRKQILGGVCSRLMGKKPSL